MSAEKEKSLGCRAQNPDTDSICAALSYAYLKIRQKTIKPMWQNVPEQ